VRNASIAAVNANIPITRAGAAKLKMITPPFGAASFFYSTPGYACNNAANNAYINNVMPIIQ
jgi:hypothetical protein